MPSITARQWIQLLIGLVLYGVGMGLMVRAAIGVAPWDVLTQGIGRVTGLEFGVVTLLVSIVVFLLWIPLRQRPGLGTIANILVIPFSSQGTIWLVPQLEVLWAQILVFAAGLVVLALATGLYIGVGLGPGPRDGLMTGLHARTRWPIWAIRTGIEVAVTAIGWALGGNLGLGTLAFALLIGPMVHVTMPWFGIRSGTRAAREAEEAGAAG